MARPEPIGSKIQLLVEGNDQRNFFGAFIDHLRLTDVQVQNFGGVNELCGFLLALVSAPGFRDTVQSVGIVRDAEKSARDAFRSVQDSLKKAGLAVPDQPEERAGSSPAVAVLILPGGNQQEGMLETLLCQSFAGDPEEACIDDFFRCVEALSDVSIQRRAKARARSYLATKPEPHLSVGVAAKRGYWDLNHPVFERVQQFLSLRLNPELGYGESEEEGHQEH